MLSTRSFLRLSSVRGFSTTSSARKQQTFFSSPQFAIVGASTSPSKWGSKFLKLFQSAQLPVTAVNPNYKTIGGTTCVPSVTELVSPQKTSILVVTPPAVTLRVLKEAKAVNTPMIWIQPGAADSTVHQFISANNMEDKVVLDGPELRTAPFMTIGDPPSSSSGLDAVPEGSSSTDGSLLTPPSPERRSSSPGIGGSSGAFHILGVSNPTMLKPTPSSSASTLRGDPDSTKTSVSPRPDGGPCGSITMLQSIIDQKGKDKSNSSKASSDFASDAMSAPRGLSQRNSKTPRIGLRAFGSIVNNKRHSLTPSFDATSTGIFTVDKEFPGMP